MIIFLLIFFSPVEIYIRWSCNPFLSCRQPVRKSPLLWSPWQQPSVWAQAGFASWSGFDFYVVKAIIVDKGTRCLQLEIISGLEFHVCFGSLYWLNSPNEFTSACCLMLWWNGPRGLPAFWMLAFTLYWWWCIFQFSKKGDMLQITFGSLGTWLQVVLSAVDHSFSAHPFVMSWKTLTCGHWIELSPWWVSYCKAEWAQPTGIRPVICPHEP